MNFPQFLIMCKKLKVRFQIALSLDQVGKWNFNSRDCNLSVF